MYPSLKIFEGLSIPTYYLVLSVTACVGLFWIRQRARRRGFDERFVLDLSLLIMVTGFIGGRLFHVLYEEPGYYLADPFQIIAFWNGGFVFYGGALLGAASGLFYAYRHDRKNIPHYLDLFAPVVALSYALGRGACLLAGCCYGKTCDLPWAIHGLHPTQAYAAFWELGVLFILLGLEKKRPVAGRVFYWWIILHGIGRLIMEFFRADFRGPEPGMSISSWISFSLIGLGTYLLVVTRKKISF